MGVRRASNATEGVTKALELWLGRTVEGQDGRAAAHDSRAGALEGDRRGRLQHLPAALRGRLHRPAHRLRHQRHERLAVGRHDAGRRGLRGQQELLQPRGRGAEILRLPHVVPTHQGRGAENLLSRLLHQARRLRARQHVLHHHPPAPGAGRRHLRRRHHPRGARPDQRAPFKGNVDLAALAALIDGSAPKRSPTSASRPP
jgi:hypothetical protein